MNIPYEIINQWQDWVPDDPRSATSLADVYSPNEAEALRAYQRVWEVTANAVPNDFPSLDAVQPLPEWEQLAQAAAVAVVVFGRRGRLAEDRDVR